MSLDQWSQTPASNDMANYFQTGMAPSKVKNAGWDVMADICQQLGPGSWVTSGGSANAQTITNTRALGALYAGRIVEFNPGFTNTGAMTLQEDGLTAKNVFAYGSPVTAGMVQSGVIARCRLGNTNYQLLNPQRSTGSFTLTLTGVTSGSGTVIYSLGQDGFTANFYVPSDITGTSNSTSFGGTGWPTAIQLLTAYTLAVPFRGEDNGAAPSNPCMMTITNSGTVTFFKDWNSSGWTSTGTKGFLSFSNYTYSIA